MTPAQAIVRVLALAAALMAAGLAGAQPPEALKLTAERVESTDECRRCHFRRPDELKQLVTLDGFCVEEEAGIWDTQDKHRQAFLLLITERNRPLTEQILGFPLADVLTLPSGPAEPRAVSYRSDADPQKLADMQACLACHAPVAEPIARGSAQRTLASGVSCQACHGPGRLYMTPHQDSTAVWRIVKAEAKETLFGLRDVRHPVKRAMLCASCHIGSFSDEWKPDEKSPPRFVRHEWYAKGHPPLPSFEMAAFTSQMPLHWRHLSQKLSGGQKFAWYDAAPEGKDLEAQVARFIETLPRSVKIERSAFASSWLDANAAGLSPTPAADLPRTREVLVSAVGVLGAYASLLADVPAEMRTDFALYDCGACHHELRSRLPSESRVRRRLPPGRPPPAFWPLALARPAAEQSDGGAALEAALVELDAALGARPFGQQAQVKTAAEKLRVVSLTVAGELSKRPVDERAAAALLASLADPRHDEDRDFHAARQRAWAIRAVLYDLAAVPLRGDGSPPASRALSPAVGSVLGLSPQEAIPSSDPQVRLRIEGLFGDDPWQGPLRLRLPAGQQESVVGQLPHFLEAISAYESAWFRERLRPIQEAFPRK
jgi:hypothetical protein